MSLKSFDFIFANFDNDLSITDSPNAFEEQNAHTIMTSRKCRRRKSRIFHKVKLFKSKSQDKIIWAMNVKLVENQSVRNDIK